MTSSDLAMARYAKGDTSAFEEVYDAVAPRLENYLRRRLREKSQIEDIVQQTFLEMHRARGTFIPGAPVMPWAFTIASHIATAVCRRLARFVVDQLEEDDTRIILSAVGSPPGGDAYIEARELGRRLSMAYKQLTDAQRAAFDLVKIEGLSVATVAAMLGTTVVAIKLRIHKARLAFERAARQDSSAVFRAAGLADVDGSAPFAIREGQ